jgi:hypothetical protein
MTNLLNIFEYCKDNEKDLVNESMDFLQKHKSKVLTVELKSRMTDVHRFHVALCAKDTYTLSYNDIDIDFIHLIEQIQEGKISQYISLARIIKAEMVLVINADNLEEFKKLNNYWDSLQLHLEKVVRG